MTYTINWPAVASYPDNAVVTMMVAVGCRDPQDSEVLEKLHVAFPEFFGDPEQDHPVTWEKLLWTYNSVVTDHGPSESHTLDNLQIPGLYFGFDQNANPAPPIPDEWLTTYMKQTEDGREWPLDYSMLVVLPETAEWPESVLIWAFEDDGTKCLCAIPRRFITT